MCKGRLVRAVPEYTLILLYKATLCEETESEDGAEETAWFPQANANKKISGLLVMLLCPMEYRKFQSQ